MTGFEVLGIALAIPGIVDLCISYAQSLLRKYHSFKNFQSELESLIFKVEAHWTNLEFEIKFFTRVQDYVEEHIQLHFGKLANALYNKLQKIGLQIEIISNQEKKLFFRKSKFTLLIKKSLEEAITEFTSWQELLQPILFLLTRNPDPRIDQQMRDGSHAVSSRTILRMGHLRQALKPGASKTAPVVLDPADYHYSRQLIEYTTVTTKRLPNGSDVIIDSISCEGPAGNSISKDIRGLARVLREVEPMTFGIPSCAGLIKVKSIHGKLSKLEMVFDVPRELENPRSLRSLLISLEVQQPINARIQLAKRLARTVLFVHSADFVHKNFRPETIILFDHRDRQSNQSLSQEIGFPFLVGFQKIRLASGPTAYMGDSAWEQNIYRHPSRQGEYPEQAYNMQHDIYSLGVCLLEIALWKSFVLRDMNGAPRMSAESQQLFSDGSAFEIKQRLIDMAWKTIPGRLGNRYAEVTVSCLKCLDESSDDDSEGLAEEDISVGVSYIEKILGKLEEINV